MSTFCVFVPGDCRRHRSSLVDLGIGELDDVSVDVYTQDGTGPQGMRGLLFYFQRCDEPLVKIQPDKWLPLAKLGELQEGRAWIGYLADNPPNAKSLARGTMQPGKWLKLSADYWHIPVARQLPRQLAMNADRSISSRIHERFAAFFDKAYASLDWFRVDDDGKSYASFEEAFSFCCEALAINYRICPEMVSEFRLLDSDKLFEIPRIVSEFDALAAELLAQKKTEPCQA